MSAPLRISSLSPPPIPSFVKARPGTLPGSGANSGESPGFSLDLAGIRPAQGTRQHTSADIEGLACGLVKYLQNNDPMRTHAASFPQPVQAGVTTTDNAGLTPAQKADLAFHLMLQIRNKLMDAYREIQQIQI